MKAKYYIRYTDDFVIVHHDLNYLLSIQHQIEEFLAKQLKLQLHPHKVEIRKYSRGIDFLGYVTLPHARVLRTRTKKRIIKKMRYKVKELKMETITEKSFLQTFGSYSGVLSHANTYRLKQKLKQEIWELLKSIE